MTGKKQKVISSRRNFLRGSLIAGAGTVVAGGLPATAIAATSNPEEKPSEEGYRVTRHILDYYKSASS